MCGEMGIHNFFLDDLSNHGCKLVGKAFLQSYRWAKFDGKGSISSRRAQPMVASTLRAAASNPATMFKRHHRQSPFHFKGSGDMLPSIKQLLRGFTNIDPPPKGQKAVTPKLLRYLTRFGLREMKVDVYDHAVDLIVGAFFFAMRSCEYTRTPRQGRTKRITLGDVVFRDDRKRVVSHKDAELNSKAQYVSITFKDQKNGHKMETRTQSRSGDRMLCPVRSFARAAVCCRQIPAADEDTPLCCVGQKDILVSSEFTKKLLRDTCQIYGGAETFGFEAAEIGNHSLRSGAAMALFMMNHSQERIMILGRWNSDAFLAYIRPQVLEWTSNMA
jgi:hypothetical protein